jgi:hypothetical protein
MASKAARREQVISVFPVFFVSHDSSFRIYIHKRSGKLGLGSAYMDGIKFAKHDFVVIMDADMSHHPESIPDMLLKQQEKDFDIVTGSRYIKGGGVSGWDLRRKLTSRVANFIADTLLNPGCSDLTGSFRLCELPIIDDTLRMITCCPWQVQEESSAGHHTADQGQGVHVSDGNGHTRTPAEIHYR